MMDGWHFLTRRSLSVGLFGQSFLNCERSKLDNEHEEKSPGSIIDSALQRTFTPGS
jgi:hypothetical protein